MRRTFRMNLNDTDLKNTIRYVKEYKKWVLEKEEELRNRLAELGASVASIQFAGATYDGTNDVSVRVDSTGSVAVIYAEGKAVAFIEFGSGAKYGYGHTHADELGMGPGTYPEGKGYWDNPNGWYYAHGKKSYGNPPAMAMVKAIERMTEELTTIAREVFGH